VTIAFAISGPSVLLAEPAGFFGSERRLNRFTGRTTQPTSDQLLLISTVLSTINACDRKSEMLIVNTQHLCKEANIFRAAPWPSEPHKQRVQQVAVRPFSRYPQQLPQLRSADPRVH
jgi:hypothetical protein